LIGNEISDIFVVWILSPFPFHSKAIYWRHRNYVSRSFQAQSVSNPCDYMLYTPGASQDDVRTCYRTTVRRLHCKGRIRIELCLIPSRGRKSYSN